MSRRYRNPRRPRPDVVDGESARRAIAQVAGERDALARQLQQARAAIDQLQRQLEVRSAENAHPAEAEDEPSPDADRAQRLAADLANLRRHQAEAIEQGGTTLRDFLDSQGQPGYFAQFLEVYDREGEPCHRCAEPVRREVIGQRSTYFCFRCQR